MPPKRGWTVGDFSSFLYAKPSFLEGAARVLDFTGALNRYNDTPTGEGADYRALVADWRAIGSDIQTAMAQHQNEEAPDLVIRHG